jgi:hypothetical protein
MKKSYFLALVTVLVCSISVTFGQTVKTALQISDQQNQIIFASLNLGDQQKAEVKDITLASAEKFIQAQKNIDSSAEFEKELGKIYTDRDTKIKALLSSSQIKSYEKLVAEKKLNYKR